MNIIVSTFSNNKGTYSKMIPLEKGDESKFAAIMDVSFKNSLLVFKHIPISLHLGDISKFF